MSDRDYVPEEYSMWWVVAGLLLSLVEVILLPLGVYLVGMKLLSEGYFQ